MSDRPPPFSALRAVEAASRHRSFTWAAKELQITHSAVSQSIRRLEADLGTMLFERKGGAMEPSEAALRLAETYSEAAQALDRTLREITGSDDGALAVSMPAEFGRLWFGGKLARLAEAVPDLRIEVRTGDLGAKDRPSDVEIEFAMAEGPAPSDAVTEVLSFPVCSPAFAARKDLARPREVLRSPLISVGGLGWDRWAAHFEVAARAPANVFDDMGMALEAAAQGTGVALTHLFAAEAQLDSGRLVALPLEAPSGLRLAVSAKAQGGKADLIARFAMWFRLEVGRSLALHTARRGGGVKIPEASALRS
jgi:DNA-binding transcriptional LysR family regulator